MGLSIEVNGLDPDDVPNHLAVSIMEATGESKVNAEEFGKQLYRSIMALEMEAGRRYKRTEIAEEMGIPVTSLAKYLAGVLSPSILRLVQCINCFDAEARLELVEALGIPLTDEEEECAEDPDD